MFVHHPAFPVVPWPRCCRPVPLRLLVLVSLCPCADSCCGGVLAWGVVVLVLALCPFSVSFFVCVLLSPRAGAGGWWAWLAVVDAAHVVTSLVGSWGCPSLKPLPWCSGVTLGPLLSQVLCTPGWLWSVAHGAVGCSDAVCGGGVVLVPLAARAFS